MPTEPGTESPALQFPTHSTDQHKNLILLAKNPIFVENLPVPADPPAPSCWDTNTALLVVVLAGFLVLVLLYQVLHLKHKLRMAQAGNALEYFGFYHMAQYSVKKVDTAVKVADPCPPPAVITVDTTHHVSPILPLPTPPSSAGRPPQPIIYTTPPSPPTDAAVYSRIGALRLSRISGVSQAQVVLFEHSSL